MRLSRFLELEYSFENSDSVYTLSAIDIESESSQSGKVCDRVIGISNGAWLYEGLYEGRGDYSIISYRLLQYCKAPGAYCAFRMTFRSQWAVADKAQD